MTALRHTGVGPAVIDHVLRPGHHMCGPGRYLLAAVRAAIGLAGLGSGNRTHQIRTVDGVLYLRV